MKRKLVVLSLALIALVISGASIHRSIEATGTIVSGVASLKKFSKPIRHTIIMTNETDGTEPLFIRLHDEPTTATVSSTSKDFKMERGDVVIIKPELLEKHPVQNIGVYTTATLPSLHVVGWGAIRD